MYKSQALASSRVAHLLASERVVANDSANDRASPSVSVDESFPANSPGLMGVSPPACRYEYRPPPDAETAPIRIDGS